jgi:hypothetical protein
MMIEEVRFERRLLALGCAALLAVFGASACGDSGGDDGDQSAAGQGATAGDHAGHAGSHAGANAGEGGGSGAAGTSAAGQGAAGSQAGTGASGSGAGTGAEDAGTGQVGVCGQRGMSTVDETSFMGFEEFYVIGEEGFGDDICVVRFDVNRVGDAPGGCNDPAGDYECVWTHLVELSNPMVVTDESGVCASSELALDADAIAELDGSRAAYGFVPEFAGHNSVLLKYYDDMSKWDAFGMGTWDEGTGAFRFDHRDGLCDY